VAARHLGHGGASVDRRGGDWRAVVGRDRRSGEQELEGRASLDRGPQLRSFRAHGDRSALVDELVEPLAPLIHRAKTHDRHEHVVELVGVARPGSDLVANALDGVRVEPPEVARLDR
jgi:hypothetical protein